MNSKNKKNLFISVKPEFADKIISKEKNIELRKLKPNVKAGDNIIIYASSPYKAVVGYGTIKRIIIESTDEMWSNHSEFLGIDKVRYDEYYKGKKFAIGIEINNIKRINPISLNKLRMLDSKFHPPQTYRYISSILIYRTIIKCLKKRNYSIL